MPQEQFTSIHVLGGIKSRSRVVTVSQPFQISVADGFTKEIKSALWGFGYFKDMSSDPERAGQGNLFHKSRLILEINASREVEKSLFPTFSVRSQYLSILSQIKQLASPLVHLACLLVFVFRNLIGFILHTINLGILPYGYSLKRISTSGKQIACQLTFFSTASRPSIARNYFLAVGVHAMANQQEQADPASSSTIYRVCSFTKLLLITVSIISFGY